MLPPQINSSPFPPLPADERTSPPPHPSTQLTKSFGLGKRKKEVDPTKLESINVNMGKGNQAETLIRSIVVDVAVVVVVVLR